MTKTHRVVKDPLIPVQYLADYMAASHQARRGIVQKCKYKSLARVFQHQIARKTIADHILGGNPLPGDLSIKAQAIKDMLADSDFDALLFQHNADFVEAFSTNSLKFGLAEVHLAAPSKIEDVYFHGTKVRFTPSLLTYRTTQANTQKIGAIMFRYAKAKPVAKDVAEWQCAFMFGYFSDHPFLEHAKPEEGLCRVLCAVSGSTHTAPKKPIYKYNEMKAVCADIAERWEKTPPPTGAII